MKKPNSFEFVSYFNDQPAKMLRRIFFCDEVNKKIFSEKQICTSTHKMFLLSWSATYEKYLYLHFVSPCKIAASTDKTLEMRAKSSFPNTSRLFFVQNSIPNS